MLTQNSSSRNSLIQQINIYENIENIMHAVAESSVKHSYESIQEPFVSRYENHFDPRKNLDEEFEIAVNGPSLSNCNRVCDAMDKYWRDKSCFWHFFKTTILESFTEDDSVVLTRMKSAFYGYLNLLRSNGTMFSYLYFILSLYHHVKCD